MAVVLRIKFPPTYPLIYKTLRIDKELTVSQAIEFISETLHVAAGENIGIYIPHQQEWLDNDVKLKEYPVLEDAVSFYYSIQNKKGRKRVINHFYQEEVEFKDKNEQPPPPPPEESNCCCLIM